MSSTSETVSSDKKTNMSSDKKSGKKKKATFNTLQVSQIRPLTDDSVEVSFAVPENLQDDYDYVPGQYVALRATIDGKEVRRSYSICDSPGGGVIRVGIKRDFGGVFSTWANTELQVGDEIDVMNPQGAFTSQVHVTGLNNPQQITDEVEQIKRPHLVAVAAGSGITPIMAIAQSVLQQSSDATFELIYGNKGGDSVMFAEEIGDLKDKYPTRFSVHHILSRQQRPNPMFSGRIDEEKLNDLLDHVVQTEDVSEWFLCGPYELVQLVRRELGEREVADKAIRYELFSTGKPTDGPRPDAGATVKKDPDGNNITVKFTLDGSSDSVQSPESAKETVLNAALRQRSDVPFACAGGVCGTCRAKVLEGEYEMEENFALEKDEVEQGYVLTCQTRPMGDSITVDYDA